MTTIPLHAPPAWRAVLAEQLRVTFLRTRVVGVALAGAALLLGGMMIDSALDIRKLDRLGHSAEAATVVVFSGLPSSFPVVVAILLPFLMWAHEDTGRRAYHRMMPIAQSAHGLTRTLAGWVWMLSASMMWVIATALFNLICSRITGRPVPAFQDVWWMWLVPITSATVAYLYVSAAAVGSRWPAARRRDAGRAQGPRGASRRDVRFHRASRGRWSTPKARGLVEVLRRGPTLLPMS